MVVAIQEIEDPGLEVFVNIRFDSAGNPSSNIKNIISCSCTPDLTANTCNKNINHYFLMEQPVKLNHLSSPFQADFWKWTQGVWKYTCRMV